MTLTLGFIATDGVLAVADGIRTQATDDPQQPSVLATDDRKLVVVPGRPALVLSSGRAIYGTRHASEVLADAFVDVVDPAAPYLDELARRCTNALSEAALARPNPHNAQLLIIGYEPDRALSAYRVDVPPRDFGDGYGLAAVRPVHVASDFPLLVNPAGTGVSLAVLELFNRFQQWAAHGAGEPPEGGDYVLAGMTLAQTRQEATRLLSDWLDENAEMAASWGVGGEWSLAEIRATCAVRVQHNVALRDLTRP